MAFLESLTPWGSYSKTIIGLFYQQNKCKTCYESMNMETDPHAEGRNQFIILLCPGMNSLMSEMNAISGDLLTSSIIIIIIIRPIRPI